MNEDIALLKKGGTKGYSETRSALHNSLIVDGGIFMVIIDQLAEEGNALETMSTVTFLEIIGSFRGSLLFRDAWLIPLPG